MRTNKKLSQKIVDSIKACASETTEWDGSLPGFGLRTRPSGAQAYIVVYRNANRIQRRVTIGSPAIFSLEQARRKAKEILFASANGTDPAEAKSIARNTTVKNVFAQYVERHMSSFCKGHYVRVSGIFGSEILPRIGDKPISSVTRSDIRGITDVKIAEGKKSAANNIHRAASGFLSWCVDREVLNINPLAGSTLPNRHKSRDRYLNRRELVTVLRASAYLNPQWNGAIYLLTLTGQRKSEVLGAELSEFNLSLKRWTIPAERSKNRHAQTVHLCPAAIAVIERMPRATNQQYLFQSSVTKIPRPITDTNFSIRKLKKLAAIGEWRLHDLRRSVATHMASLKVSPHVIQVVLNHRSGIRSGVTAIYNRYTYAQETREAWELWGTTLTQWMEDEKLSDSSIKDDVE